MYFERQLLPLTNILKNSSQMINLVLIILLVAMLFPVREFFPSNPIDGVESELVKFVSNPVMMTVLTLLLYCVFLTNNDTMFVLVLYIIHRYMNKLPINRKAAVMLYNICHRTSKHGQAFVSSTPGGAQGQGPFGP